MISLHELKEKRNRLLVDMQAIALKGFNTESRSSFDRMNTEVEEIEKDISRAETLVRLEARHTEGAQFERSPRPGISVSGSRFDLTDPEQRKKAISKAFQQYAVRGLDRMDAEYRDLLTTSDTTGGALIPQLFMGSLISAKKYFGSVPGRVRQKVTSNNGAPMKISYANDTANGLVLLGTEGSTSPTETDPAFQSHILGVDTVSGGLVKVSFQELEDSSFDLDALIRESFSIRYLRGLEVAVTTGKDSSGNTLPNQATGGLLGAATVGTTTSVLANGVGWTDITNTFGALDPAYLNDSTAWVFNSNTRATLLGMKDGFGRPFWTPDPSADGPFGKLLGYDVLLNQAMPNTGVANATPILFGDLQQAYMLRTDGQPSILRLNERYADTLEVGFYLYTRIGGISLNAGISPLVSLKLAAS